MTATCPCGSNKTFKDCCETFLSGTKQAETPEQLMRSRYTAYAIPYIDYIERTMREPAAKDFNKESAYLWAKNATWQKLEVLNTSTNIDKGFVEFKAYYFENGKNHILHEISEFHRIDNQWYYVDGKNPEVHETTVKIGRNDACPCGSGKKYKKCCLIK